MASQYVDVFNSPSGGTILAIVLIVVTAILSGAAGAYYYAEHKRLISSTLLSVAILLDVLSVIIRLFAKYDAEIDEIIYFPDTADAESILMACIIFGLTLFGIFLTYSESKKVFNSAYKQYRIALERNAVLTEALPRFASLLQDLEEYMDKHNVEYQRED